MAKKKTSWHTDIVVDGEGLGLMLKPGRDGCYDLVVTPDVPGRPSKKAIRKLRKTLEKRPDVCSETEAKSKVAGAIRSLKAHWNRWHREAYHG